MKSGKSFIGLIVLIFPITLVGMVIMGLVLYEKRRVDKVEEHPMAKKVTIKAIVSHQEKLRDFMTPRSFTDGEDLQRMKMTTSFISGSVDTLNTGMRVDSEIALTESGHVWKDYTLNFGERGTKQHLTINYAEAKNAEISVALMITEALPQRELDNKFSITFSPTKKTSPLFQTWVTEAELRGKGQSLYADEIDWDYLVKQILSYTASL